MIGKKSFPVVPEWLESESLLRGLKELEINLSVIGHLIMSYCKKFYFLHWIAWLYQIIPSLDMCCPIQ